MKFPTFVVRATALASLLMGGFMRFFLFRCGMALLVALLLATAVHAADFYSPLPAAKNAIDFDNRGFLINGQRTFIASAGIEYARVPRPLWRDRLLKIKRAGFNCVEIYTFWNYHEVSPGKWDFTGDKDVGAFLDLAHQLGLYITVRVGPYVCAEWENGGFPMYLRFLPGLRIRQDEPQYLKAVDGWYDHILPIVASRQIDRGGGVIMVQLENEDDEGWGAWDLEPDRVYFKNLLASARAHGIDVLTFFSGMNHGGDPAPKEPISSKGRENPWYTTEFWSSWYSRYGAFDAADLIHYDRAAWRFLENGGNGFNVYMFHGGTNFATWNNNETSASYDYAGAIGQAGDLRSIYFKYKRVALFGRSFQNILENCDDATAAHANDFPGLTVRARTGPAGTLVFLDNPGDKPATAKFADGSTLTLTPGEVAGLVHDFPLDSTFKLVASESRILETSHEDKTTTLVIYGPAGSTGQITVSASAALQNSDGWTSTASPAGASTLSVTFPAAHPEVHVLRSGGQTLRVLAMSSELADDTYVIDTKNGTYIVTGAPYMGSFAMDRYTSEFTAELPIDATMAPVVSIYGPARSAASADDHAAPASATDKRLQDLENYIGQRDSNAYRDERTESGTLPLIDLTVPTLANWQSATADAEAAPGYDDSTWKVSDAPLPLGADDDNSAYAWYRTKIDAAAAGTKYLRVPFIGDHAIVFVNGQRLDGTFGPGAVTIPVPLQAGANSLAVLVSHSGRNKLVSTYGAIDRLGIKGLVGPVTLLPAPTPQIQLDAAVAQDFWKEHPPVAKLVAPNLDTSDPKWNHIGLHNNFEYTPQTWRDPFVVVRATLPDFAGPNRVLHAGLVNEKGTFYLNGQKIGEDDQPDSSIDLPLDAAWKTGAPNQLAIILENAHAQATVGLLTLTSGDPGTEVKGWKMRGNVTDSTSPTLAWKSVPSATPAAGTAPTPGAGANPPATVPAASNLGPGAATGVSTATSTETTAAAPGVPTWYRTSFRLPADYYANAMPILRLSCKGMSRGFVWLNGHNLGRYPEKIQVDGLYLPECWLKPGANNTVAILDDEGSPIAPAHLYVELTASRRVMRR